MRSEIQTVLDIMEHSRFGKLASLFVLDAIQKQANVIAAMNPSSFTNPLHDGEQWHGVATEIKSKIDKRFSS